MPNWKSQESRDRLVAALVASLDQKSLNYNRIAALFGQGTTYHAIEGQFRQIRKDAQQLKDDLANGTTNSAIPANKASRGASSGGSRRKAENGTNGASKRSKISSDASKDSSPSRKRDGILAGRVTKSKSITPTNGQLFNGKSNGGLDAFENHNSVRGFKEEIESSETSAANTPANSNPFEYPLSYDGTNELNMAGFYSLDDTFGGSFGSDTSFFFEA